MKKIIILICLVSIFALSACALKLPKLKVEKEITIFEIMKIGLRHDQNFVNKFEFGGDIYKTVDKDNLQNIFYPAWKSILFNEWSVTEWNNRFQCNAFAIKFVGDAGAKFYSDNWHSYSKAESPAIGFVYYNIGGNGIRHAVVWFVASDYKIYGLEPQNGKVFEFTDAEFKSMGTKNI